MRQVLRVVLATVLGAVLVATAVPAAGAAPSAPTIRVAPSRALQDGQTVAVFGSGFPPLGRLVGLAQCPAATPDDFSACIGHQLIQSVAGAYGTHFPVHRSVGSTDCA